MVVDEGMHQNLDPSPNTVVHVRTFISFPTSGDLRFELVTYSSSLDPDQDRPKKANFEKMPAWNHEKLPSMQRVKEGFDARAIRVVR